MVLAGIAGCGRSDRAAVSGKITLDGQPVEDGTISFVPSGRSSNKAAQGKVQGGSYAIPVKEGLSGGPYRIEIHSNRKTGKKIKAVPPAPPDSWIEEVREAIPARYNIDSGLKAELKAGSNQFDFELKSMKSLLDKTSR